MIYPVSNIQHDCQNVSFEGYKCAFSKKLEKAMAKGKISAAENKDLEKLLSKTYYRNLKNGFLGEGYHRSAFKLDDYYVAVVNSTYRTDPVISHAEFTDFDIIKPLKLKTYFGGVMAKFGDLVIKKNALINNQGINAGSPIQYSYNMMKNHFKNKTIPEFSSLPQRAYDYLAHDFAVLKRENLTFDTLNPNNFIKTGKSIRVVDNLETNNGNDESVLFKMLDVFLDYMQVNTIHGKDAELIDLRKNIFKKCVMASIKAEHKIPKNDNVRFDYFCDICGINNSFSDICKDLYKIKAETPKSKFLKTVKEYLDTL